MLSSNDPLHPQAFLNPGERLLWTGQPTSRPPLSKLHRVIRMVGIVDLICFAIFAAFGWANRDDLDGAGGILAVFLILSLVGGVLLIWGLPWIARRGLAQTRYGVTQDRVMIVHGMQGPRVHMIRVRAEAEIEVKPTATGVADVVFGRETDLVHTPAVPSLDGTNRTPVTRLQKFQALPEADAQAAAAALAQIKGAAGEGPVFEARDV